MRIVLLVDYCKNHVLPEKKLSCGSLGCKHTSKAKGLTEPSPHWRVKNKFLRQKKKKNSQESTQRDKLSITQELGVWKGVFVVNSEYIMSHDR